MDYSKIDETNIAGKTGRPCDECNSGVRRGRANIGFWRLEAVRNGDDPMVTGYAALATHRLIEAIEESSRTAAAINLGKEKI